MPVEQKGATMPKEIIRYSNEFVVRDGRVIYNPGLDEPTLRKDEELSHTEQISAHWSKGLAAVAQLAIQLDAEMVRRQLALYDNKTIWMGEEVLPGMLMFYTGDLKRYELQNLIRFGRKMRDDVHGADE